MLAQFSVCERIHKSPVSTDCHVEVSQLYVVLHSSPSSDAHGICTCNSTEASGFTFRVTGTLVIIRVSVLVDKCFERLNN